MHSLRLQSFKTEAPTDSDDDTGCLLMAARRQGDNALELVERLSARLRPDQVQTWQARADDPPVHIQCWVNANDFIKSIAISTHPACAGARNSKNNEAGTEALYPTWRLHEPVTLTVLGSSPVYQGRKSCRGSPIIGICMVFCMKSPDDWLAD